MGLDPYKRHPLFILFRFVIDGKARAFPASDRDEALGCAVSRTKGPRFESISHCMEASMLRKKKTWRLVFLFCLALGVGAQTALPQTWTWNNSASGPVPEPRGFHKTSAVRDPNTNEMIIFAGTTENALVNDVWFMENSNAEGPTQWINLIANGAAGSPPARGGHSAVYDSVNNRMIIFGGCLGGCLPVANDVWVLTNANGQGGTPSWVQLSPVGGPPPPRTEHNSVYDQTNNRMIIFGGQNGGGFGCSTFGDVWVLSNANGLGGTPTWTQLSFTGSPATGQYGQSAVYDAVNNIMTVFGGSGIVGGKCVNVNSVWTLSNANGLGGTPAWTNIVANGAAGSPAKRAFHMAIYDPTTNRMTTFGGNNGSSVYNDSWVLSKANGLGGTPSWSKLKPTTTPPARSSVVGVYDPATSRMTIYGGSNADGIFGGEGWTLTSANGLP